MNQQTCDNFEFREFSTGQKLPFWNAAYLLPVNGLPFLLREVLISSGCVRVRYGSVEEAAVLQLEGRAWRVVGHSPVLSHAEASFRTGVTGFDFYGDDGTVVAGYHPTISTLDGLLDRVFRSSDEIRPALTSIPIAVLETLTAEQGLAAYDYWLPLDPQDPLVASLRPNALTLTQAEMIAREPVRATLAAIANPDLRVINGLFLAFGSGLKDPGLELRILVRDRDGTGYRVAEKRAIGLPSPFFFSLIESWTPKLGKATGTKLPLIFGMIPPDINVLITSNGADTISVYNSGAPLNPNIPLRVTHGSL